VEDDPAVYCSIVEIFYRIGSDDNTCMMWLGCCELSKASVNFMMCGYLSAYVKLDSVMQLTLPIA